MEGSFYLPPAFLSYLPVILLCFSLQLGKLVFLNEIWDSWPQELRLWGILRLKTCDKIPLRGNLLTQNRQCMYCNEYTHWIISTSKTITPIRQHGSENKGIYGIDQSAFKLPWSICMYIHMCMRARVLVSCHPVYRASRAKVCMAFSRIIESQDYQFVRWVDL